MFAGNGAVNHILQRRSYLFVPISSSASCRRDCGGSTNSSSRTRTSGASSKSKSSSVCTYFSLLRQRYCRCHASVQTQLEPSGSDMNSNSGNTSSRFPNAPDLASLSRAGLPNAVLLANIMMPPHERQQVSPVEADQPPAEKPNDPITPTDLVEALEMVVRSRGHQANPEQLAEILQEVESADLLTQFTAQQLALLTKDLGILCCELPIPFLMQLVRQLGSHMTTFDIPQLANVSWALLRVMPISDEQIREFLGVDSQWLHQYEVTCENQLTQLLQNKQHHHQQQQHNQQQQQQSALRLPSGQQLANLLLVPAAVQQPFSSRCQQLFEEAMVVCQGRLCGMAVAQTLSCYVRLKLRLQPELAEVLLSHFKEDLLLYDHEEIAQVAVAAAVMQLRLPNTVLADMTERAQLLEAAGRADPADVAELQEALDCLAKAAAGFGTTQQWMY